MKLITYTQGSGPRPGLALSDTLGIDLLAADPTLPANWHGLFGVMDAVRAVHDRLAPRPPAAGTAPPLPWVDLTRAQLLAPIVLPSKIICVGLNYRDHAEEQNKPLPQRPMLFSKAPSCLQMPGGPIELPEDLDQVDAEAEIAVVIGRPGRRISRETGARAHRRLHLLQRRVRPGGPVRGQAVLPGQEHRHRRTLRTVDRHARTSCRTWPTAWT